MYPYPLGESAGCKAWPIWKAKWAWLSVRTARGWRLTPSMRGKHDQTEEKEEDTVTYPRSPQSEYPVREHPSAYFVEDRSNLKECDWHKDTHWQRQIANHDSSDCQKGLCINDCE
jgi:hypothetical protein